ncbi:MAG: CocE/NonD family hydrolase [Hyphomonadaceae bacterium]|nr:CocE/NonD family hydrolase [Hyphomonadaceae bacterium]
MRVLEIVRARMRDGVELEADVYLPEGEGPFPTLLERTPYGRRGVNHADVSRADPTPRSKPEIAAAFVARGYAYVLQDCRGRYGSGGEFVKYLSEGADGVDTLAWIRAQRWCDGRIGTLGLSYCAHVQTALAAHDPPGLKAMFVDSGGFSSAYHSGIRQGGAFELKQLTWAMKHALLSPKTAADPDRRAALEAQDLRAWLRIAPWRIGASPLSAAPEYEAYVVEQWRREVFDEFWRQPELYARGTWAGFADVPQVYMSSWYDPYARTAIENFTALSHLKHGPVKLIIGPWTHGQRSVSYAGDVEFGAAAPLDGALARDYIALRVAWFDRYLRDMPSPDPLPAPVSYFMMGGGSGAKTPAGRLDHGGAWRTADQWPPAKTRPTAFFLNPRGALKDHAPDAPSSASFTFDPAAPTPTIGGAIASGAPVMAAGAFDQREREDIFAATHPGRALADRPDVLVFETAPLERPLDVAGDVQAHLWVSSDAPDTDVAITLIDVHPPSRDYPEGYAMNLAHGILRLRFRDGYESAKLMSPGEIYRITVEAYPTANRFMPGHRIRVQISSSNFPHFDVNPNTGAPAGEVTTPRQARNTIHFAPEQPSHILLSVFR